MPENFNVGDTRVILVIHHRHSEEYIGEAIKVLDLKSVRKSEGAALMTEIEAGILAARSVPLPEGDKQ